MNRITSFLQPSIHESQTLFSPDLLCPSIHPPCPTPISLPQSHTGTSFPYHVIQASKKIAGCIFISLVFNLLAYRIHSLL